MVGRMIKFAACVVAALLAMPGPNAAAKSFRFEPIVDLSFLPRERNRLGLAVDSQRQSFFLADGSDGRYGQIHQIGFSGSLIRSFNLQEFYARSFPTGVDVDPATGNLWVINVVPVGQSWVRHLLEISPATGKLLHDTILPDSWISGGAGFAVTDGHFHFNQFHPGAITETNQNLEVIRTISMSDLLPDGGLYEIANYKDGYIGVGQTDSDIILEIDSNGKELSRTIAPEPMFGIDYDPQSDSLYASNNNRIYQVLSVPEPSHSIFLVNGVLFSIYIVRRHLSRRNA